MTLRPVLAVLVAALCSNSCWAEASVYAGLRAGSVLDGRFDDFGGNIDTDTPYGGHIGWNLNPTFAIEFGASNLGSSKQSQIADGGFDVDGALYQLGVVASLLLSDQFNLVSRPFSAFRFSSPRRC